MAPPPMGHLDGFSVDGGRKDEPDLRLGNNGFSNKYVSSDLFTDKNIGSLKIFCHLDIQKEDTLYKKTKDCKVFVNVLNEGGVRPGIKVNKSTIKWQIYDNIGNPVGKDIFMMSMGDDFGSEGTFATHTTGGNHQSAGADVVTNHKPEFILDTGAEVNVTGDEDIFFALSFEPEGFGLRAANKSEMESYMCGYLSHPMYQMNYVYFSKDVGRRTIVSGPQLDVLGYSSKFEGGTCKVRDPETGFLVGEGRLVDNKKYLMDYLKIPLNRDPVQVPNVEDVPLPDGPVGPLSVFTPLWTAIRTLLRRFSGSLRKQASEEAPRRPPV